MNDEAAETATSARAGTRSLARMVRLMRTVAARPQFGWRLSDLAAASGLDRGTVHRMLACMVDERLVEQRPADRHYLPGPLMYELGLALPQHAQFQRRAAALAAPFARRLNGVAVLVLRSGQELVCSVRTGALPVTGSVLYPGTRRPLFSTATGVAILQALPEAEASAVLRDNIAQEVARCGPVRLAGLQRMREQSRRHGFGVNLGAVLPGIHAFGAPLRGGGGEVFAAVGLLGTPELYGEERLPAIRDELFALAAALEQEARRFEVG